MIFFTGVVATLAWQSYGDVATEVVSAWSPRCSWQVTQALPALQAVPVTQTSTAPQSATVPQNAPASQSTSASPDQAAPVSPDQLTPALDQLKATSLALDSVRQVIDKLATQITKLQANEKDTADRSPPVQPPAAAPPRRAVPSTSSRALPVH
jgi:hypothetical protein